VVVAVVLAAAAVAVWRMWALGRRLARLDDLRAAWETRFSGTADELLRLKRKQSDAESVACRLEADIAALRPVSPEAATAQVAMVQSELSAVRERLERAEEKLEAVADHTIVTHRERGTVEGLVKAAGNAAARAERAAARLEAGELLRAGETQLAAEQYVPAVETCTRCLELLQRSGDDSPQLRFRALHARATAHLRRREPDAVLADAAELENVTYEKAPAAARLLAGVARLWQGAVARALEDFAAAVRLDPGVRGILPDDQDLAAWAKAHPRKAGRVKRFIRRLVRQPKAGRKPAATRRKPLRGQRRRRR
jgi:tetratricopeptide (TPR) repeat protein